MVCLRISAKRSLHSAGRPCIATRGGVTLDGGQEFCPLVSLPTSKPRPDPQVGVF